MSKKTGRNKDLRCDTIDELRAAFNEIKSVVAGDTRFMAQALMFLAEQTARQSQRPERKPSAWNQFFAKGMRTGKSPGEIGKEWRERPRLLRAG
jgi:hypothetical protein